MTMPYELHRSSIITGTLNCFCLACNSFLQSRKKAVCHIETSSHCESLSTVPYLEKFKDQCIRKFKNGYFCDFCNKLMQTMMHVNLHLSEEHHKQNRGRKLIKSLGRDIIAFDNVLIEERAWHGLIDNTCCICVTEFEDEVLHKQNASHALSLIQKPVKFGENDVIYRPIDDSSFHCVTCNKLLPLSTMNNHFIDADHLDVYTTCKMSLNKNSDEKVEDTNINYGDDNSAVNEINSYIKLTNDDDDDENNNNNKDGTETTDPEKCSIDIHSNQLKSEDYLNSGASAETGVNEYNKTTEIKAVLDVKDQYEGYNESSVDNVLIQDADVLQQVSHLNTACENVDAFESGSSHPNINHTDDVGIIASDNNITYNNSNNAFCHPCKVKLQFNLKSLNEHVKGARHKKNLMATQTRQSMVVFVDSLLRVQGRREMEINSGYLINNKYYITLLSYLLLAKNTDGFRCLLCSITLPSYPEVPVEHIDKCSLPKGKHIQIITSEKDEFIREIKLGAFHCGFCHIVVPGWNEMQIHLRSPKHNRQKSESYHQFKLINFKMLQRYVKLVEL